MSARKEEKDTFHFVAFQDPSNAVARKSLEKSRARAHAARVTHSRRKAKRGQTVVKWIIESSGSPKDNTPKQAQDKVQVAGFKISPLSYLGQDKVDPFGSNPHTVLPKYLQSILDYAYESIHPKIITVHAVNSVSEVKISWRRIGQEWPLMYHLQVACAANLARAGADNERLPHKIEVLRMKHQARGLALVTKELQNLKGPASDSLIMALIMAAFLTDPNPTSAQSGEVVPPSPLATAWNLHLYASLTLMPSMIQALMELVVSRGGMDALQEYGLKNVLQLSVGFSTIFVESLADVDISADLMVSSRLNMSPSFPWVLPTTSILHGPKYQPDHEAVMMSMVIGTGFRQIDPIAMDLANALRAAGEVTVALDHYVQRRPNPPIMADIVNAANQTHHRLASLGPRITMDPQKTDYLWNLCRVAGLIYSDLVLLPLPPTTGVRPRLAGELRLAMESFEVFEAEETAYIVPGTTAEDYTCLVLWALMMGGLAALNTPHKGYFVRKMQEYVLRWPYIIEWGAYTSLMATYLWWDHIFAEPVAMLWTEVTLSLADVVQQGSVFTQPSHDTPPADQFPTLPLHLKTEPGYRGLSVQDVSTSSLFE
ncbi:uncharacterized protein Z520_11394 [Fonsecaea multimorphosa CBS 102226]|uniref:Transcription factor domain-containing protein n=1 Tax=Fonsecaea multimorphosa CBS 102226 TaxID=1442371 RepID=A0A0D2K993_9EURO|nr:uncharacterized protein Z520_11394 [Fonsecaea multimorphosa CBS 102226]KIX92918.1 hypothetical protein Z520_11394 [Fonsecaea multimorphosa CBS 102226]OAL18167.1 hypothetical protein AYO22_10944 [Fonsecaea multimorphosa]